MFINYKFHRPNTNLKHKLTIFTVLLHIFNNKQINFYIEKSQQSVGMKKFYEFFSDRTENYCFLMKFLWHFEDQKKLNQNHKKVKISNKNIFVE